MHVCKLLIILSLVTLLGFLVMGGGLGIMPLNSSESQMKKILIFALCLILLGCDQSPEVLSDPMYYIMGTIVDSASSVPIASVLVGATDSSIPDSLFFAGDSVGSYRTARSTITSSTGTFELMWFGIHRDTTKVYSLYAYKSGYKLWRFVKQPVQIRPIDESRDEITIQLVTKDG